MTNVVWVELMTLIASKTNDDIADLRYGTCPGCVVLTKQNPPQQGRSYTKLQNFTQSSLA
jgi:hypothetical protein